jgi:hypothetical protein
MFGLTSHLYAAWAIPRTDLRLELLLATGSQDTSWNNRIVSFTGAVPTYETDSVYGISYAKFNGNGGYRVNTSWSATSSNDFSFSFWMKLPETNLSSNSSSNITNLLSSVVGGGNIVYTKTYYDKPMVIFSSKNTNTDTSSLRLAISKEGQCSFNGDSRNISGYTPGYAWNGVGYYNDFFTTQSSPFNCNVIKDGKWHHIMIVRKTGNMKIMVDGVQLWSGANWASIWKVISLGNMGFAPNPVTYYNLYPSVVINDILSKSYYKGGMFGFREYSVALSDSDIESHYNEFRYIQSNLVGTWSISISLDSYISPNLTIDINNLPLLLSKDSVQYEYAFNSGSYLPFPNITDISTGTGSFNYQTTINLASLIDGQVTLYFRIKNGSKTQNIGNISFMKIDSQPSINIVAPNSDTATQKYISASASTWGTLYYSLTRWTICDSSLTYDDYSDLTFTTLADNGVRVCYKAFYPNLNKTIYKLSWIIQGIHPTENTVTSPTVKLFDNYTLWQKSSFSKPLDTTSFILDLLAVSSAASQGTINGITMTDINGDGLVDFLYSRNDPIRRAIIVNNGNYTFKIVYKCAVDGTSPNYTYYGDCADATR